MAPSPATKKSVHFHATFTSRARVHADITGAIRERRVRRVRMPALPPGTRFRIERRVGEPVPHRTRWSGSSGVRVPADWFTSGADAARWLVEFDRPGFSPALLLVQLRVDAQ